MLHLVKPFNFITTASSSGATTDRATGTDAGTARTSTSRKQLHFAPLHLGRTSGEPHATPDGLGGYADELMSPSRSKSLGSAVDRALLMDAVDAADSAIAKDRPHSATQFSRKVGVWYCWQAMRLTVNLAVLCNLVVANFVMYCHVVM